MSVRIEREKGAALVGAIRRRLAAYEGHMDTLKKRKEMIAVIRNSIEGAAYPEHGFGSEYVLGMILSLVTVNGVNLLAEVQAEELENERREERMR